MFKKVVFSCNRNKSPSTYGFSMAFFSDNWNLVKGDLEGVFEEFYERGILNSSLVENLRLLDF